MPPPADETPHQVGLIHLPLLKECVGEAQRHTGVVRPLSGFEAERTAADHVGDMLVAVPRLELQRGPDGVTHGEAHEGSDSPITDRTRVLFDRLIHHAHLPQANG